MLWCIRGRVIQSLPELRRCRKYDRAWRDIPQYRRIRREADDESFLRPLIHRARVQLGEAAFGQAEQAGREAAPDAVQAELSALLSPDS